MPQENHTTTRRAILSGTAPSIAAAALAGSTVANAVAIGMAKAGEVDPILAAVEDHREAVRVHEEATVHFRKLARDDRRDTDEDPKAWLSRTQGTPRDLAYEAWTAAGDVVEETTDRLLDTPPTTLAGAVEALEWWAEFAELTVNDIDHDYGFLDADIHSVFMANVAAALRSIIERGQQA